MPDTAPAYQQALQSLLDRADAHSDELNVALAYVPDLDNREGHLTAAQDMIAALGALRTDVDAL